MNYTFMEKLFAAIRRPDLALRYLMGKQPGEFDLAEVAGYVRIDAPTIVEAGAFDGRHTRAFAERWPKGHVYAFEPHPLLAAKVREATRGLSNVTVVQAAFTDGAGATVNLYSFPDDSSIHGSSSILEPADHLRLAPNIRFGGSVSVLATTLDAWHESVGCPRVELLWLDLQGAELRVLKFGERCLKATAVCHIEVSWQPLHEGGASYSELCMHFDQCGFRPMAVRIPIATGNALFKRHSQPKVSGRRSFRNDIGIFFRFLSAQFLGAPVCQSLL